MRNATTLLRLSVIAAALTCGCDNDYILDPDFGLDDVQDGNAVCPQATETQIGGIVSVSFDGTTWGSYLSGLTFGPVLRITLDGLASGGTAPSFPISAPAVELCAPITVAADGTASIPVQFNDTFIVPLSSGSTAGEVFMTAAIYDVPIVSSGGVSTCDPTSGPVMPLSGINLTNRLSMNNCERRLVEVPLSADASTWAFQTPGAPAPGAFWDAVDFQYDYSATMKTVWPPPAGDPILGPPPSGPITPPSGGAPLAGGNIDITVVAEGYTAGDIATRFWNDIATAVTGSLSTKWLYSGSSIRNNVVIRAIPSESFISFEGNEMVARSWRIFNTVLAPAGNNLAWDMNYLRMNRVADESGAATRYIFMLLNDANCHAYAWPMGFSNDIVEDIGRDGWAYGSGSCGGTTITHELGHTIGIVQDERNIPGRSWSGPNTANCGAALVSPSTTWGQYELRTDNCPAGTVGVDQTCHVAAFSVGTHGIVAGNEDVMFPEPACGMSFNGGTEFCRVCNHSMLTRLRQTLGAAAGFTTIQNEVLGQFPMGAPFPTGQAALVCP